MKLISARHRPWVVYAAFTLLSLGIMASNLRGDGVADQLEILLLRLLSPVYSSVDWLLDQTASVWNNYVHLIDLEKENNDLKTVIQALQEAHLTLADKAITADRLQTLMDSSSRMSPSIKRANVIRRGDTLMNPTLLIDAGYNQGIREGLGVASPAGALGQIVRVGPDVSKVLTLHHPDAGIGAMLQKSRVQGVVTGSGKAACTMRFISRFDPVTPGETVVTSGLDGAFPKGIPIGTVSAIEKDSNEIFQTLEITTCVDLNTLEELIIFIMPELPQIDFGDGPGATETSADDSRPEPIGSAGESEAQP